jgi:hypothetical protein
MIPLLFGARSESKKLDFSGRPERDFLRGLYSYTCFRQQPQLAAAQGEDAGPLLNHAVTAHRRKKTPDQGETVRAAKNYRIRANEWSKGNNGNRSVAEKRDIGRL